MYKVELRAWDFKTLLPFSLPFQEASHREKGPGDEGKIRYLLL